MQGLHITGDLYHCKEIDNLLIDLPALREKCLELTLKSDLTIVDDKFYLFPEYNGKPGGITGTILLAESHLCIHTWPEISGLTLDVYVCNFTQDNSSKAELLFDSIVKTFNPKNIQINRIIRASIS